MSPAEILAELYGINHDVRTEAGLKPEVSTYLMGRVDALRKALKAEVEPEPLVITFGTLITVRLEMPEAVANAHAAGYTGAELHGELTLSLVEAFTLFGPLCHPFIVRKPIASRMVVTR